MPIRTGPGDMKPSRSKTGGKIVFFRLTNPDSSYMFPCGEETPK